METRVRRLRRARIPALAAEFRAPHGARAAARLDRDRGQRWSTPGARGDDAVATRKASQNVLESLTARVPELFGGSADLTGSNLTDAKGSHAVRRQRRPATTCTTACASSAWRPDERHGAARRAHALRRDVPRLLRLRAQRDPHGGADAPARRLRVHARLDRAGRGRPDAPAGRARGGAARSFPNVDVWRPCDALRDGSGLGRRARAHRRADLRCCCRGRTCRFRRGPTTPSRRSAAAATCSPRPRAARHVPC